MTVRHNHVCIGPLLPIVRANVITAALPAAYIGHSRVEGDFVGHAEVLYIAFKVPDDLTMVRKHGVIRGHRKVAVGHYHPIGIDVQ